MTLRFLLLPALLYTGLVCADTPAHILESKVQQLKGVEYSPYMIGEAFAPGHSDCTYQGGGMLDIEETIQEQWAVDHVRCEGRLVLLLSKQLSKSDGGVTWKVVDTLLLPPVALQRNRKRPFELVIYSSLEGLCSVQGRYGMDFIALLNWGRRERIDWRTGVKQAWTFNITQERIVPLPTQYIQCQWDEP